MSKNDIITKIETIRELEELIEEAKAEADALRDAIKQMMPLFLIWVLNL